MRGMIVRLSLASMSSVEGLLVLVRCDGARARCSATSVGQEQDVGAEVAGFRI